MTIVCGMLALSIEWWAFHPYCDPKPNYSIYSNTLAWECDCTRARKSTQFVIDEMVFEVVDEYVEKMRESEL